MKRFWTAIVVVGVVWVAALLVPTAAQDAREDDVEKTETHVLDVRDLIQPMRDYDPPTFNLQNVTSAGSGTTSGGGMFDDGEEEEWEPELPEESRNDLIDLIRQLVAMGTWDEGSGNAIRGRGGCIILTHRPAVVKQVRKLLEEIRQRSRTRMVSVHVRFVKPKAEDLQRIIDRRLVLARTELQKAELLKLAGDTVAEARTLGMDGQQVGTVASRQSNFVQDVLQEMAVPEGKDAKTFVGIDPEIGTVQDGIIVRARAVVGEGKIVVLDFRADLAQMSMVPLKNKLAEAGARPADARGRVPLADWPIELPTVKLLVFRGMYRIPDGAVLLAGGGTFSKQDPTGVYALVRVDVIEPGQTP